MKKSIFIAAFFLLIGIGKAQNGFGFTNYSHTNAFCTSGTLCTNNPGFLLAGVAYTASGAPNFFIDRTNKNGAFTSAGFEFQMEYSISGSFNCGGSPQPITNCYGVQAIETSGG